jgi:dual-specificity kinase
MKRVPKSSSIKLIDFGSTMIGKESNHSVISTRHYRAPEVILGL